MVIYKANNDLERFEKILDYMNNDFKDNRILLLKIGGLKGNECLL